MVGRTKSRSDSFCGSICKSIFRGITHVDASRLEFCFSRSVEYEFSLPEALCTASLGHVQCFKSFLILVRCECKAFPTSFVQVRNLDLSAQELKVDSV